MAVRQQTGLDLTNGIAVRTYLEALRSWMVSERSTWDSHTEQLAQFYLPRQQRFNPTSVDTGQRKDFQIVDNTGTMALKVLTAGIFSTVSSPTQEWLHIIPEQEELKELNEVADWLDDTEERFGKILLKGNYYQTLLTHYNEKALYGTGAFCIHEDQEDIYRCYTYPWGSYYISGDASQRIDCCLRIVSMTTRQLVDEYGIDNVSTQVRTLYESNAGGQKEFWWQVVIVTMRNTYFDPSKPRLDVKPWMSIHYELASYKVPQGLLRVKGYDEFPVIVGRWNVVGENFYGESPAMDALGDVRELQLLHKRKSQAIDKQVNPPMVGDPALENQKINVLPGQVTFASMREGNPGFRPAYQVDFKLEACLQNIQDCRQRINDALFKTLFLMNSESDRKDITAEEIRARQQEKMMVLGPVDLRNDNETLRTSVERIFNMSLRRLAFKPVPQALKGKPFRFQFQSILAQAQRIQRTANIDRMLTTLAGPIAVQQGVMDNYNFDLLMDDYYDDLNCPANAKRSPDEVAKIRADRQQQQQQQQAAANAKNLAPAAAVLANTDSKSDNALTRLLPQAANPGAAA